MPNRLTLTDEDTITRFKDIARDLRARKPVCPLATGGIVLLDPEDVRAAFSNPGLSNQPSRFSALAPKNRDKYVAASVASNILPFLDAPRHVALRQWASRAFFAEFKAFEPQIEAIAEAQCARWAAGTSHLLVEEVARHFVVDVIGRFVGVDLDPDEMKRYTSALFRLFAPAFDAQTFAKTNEGLEEARLQLAQALAARRKDQTPCLLNALDAGYPDGVDGARDDIILDTALLFLADGVENVEAAIANVMMLHAAEGGAVTAEFVRSAITSDTPGQTIARIAAQDLQIGDESVTAGTPVFLSLASANDGAEGEEFTFGRGRHKCIGEPLAIAMAGAMGRALVVRGAKVDATNLRYRAMFGHKWPRGVTLTMVS